MLTDRSVRMPEEAEPDSRQRIMDATYRALLDTGYADLTMSDIASLSETSTSLLHYHFNTKEDLLVAFLDHIIERLVEDFEEADELEPTERLHWILEHYVIDPDETERESFFIALGELRGAAPYNERYQARFERADTILTDGVARVLRDGANAGVFHEVPNPAGTARLIIAAADGGRTKGVALGDPGYTRDVLEHMYEDILSTIFTEQADRQWEELTDA